MRTTHIRRVAAALAAASLALTAALANAPGASAAKSTPRGTAGSHPAVVSRAVPNSPAASSYVGAGYFISLAGVTSISAQFTMPAYSCANPNDFEWLLPGIWTFDSGSFSQQVDVNFDCFDDGSTFQSDTICVNGGGCDQNFPVAVGDKIRVSLTFTPSETVGTFTDITDHVSITLFGDPNTSDDTALIGELSNGPFVAPQAAAVPTFNKVVFTKVKINGQPLADVASLRYGLATGSDVQIATGNIRADGNSFVTTFRHNY